MLSFTTCAAKASPDSASALSPQPMASGKMVEMKVNITQSLAGLGSKPTQDAGLNVGYVLDYDATSGKITNLTPHSYQDKPEIITHFEGITAVEDGYNLAATTDDGAAFASIARNSDGHFTEAKWVLVAYPDCTGPTTGNTVIGNNLMGIFTSDSGVQSYIATLAMD